MTAGRRAEQRLYEIQHELRDQFVDFTEGVGHRLAKDRRVVEIRCPNRHLVAAVYPSEHGEVLAAVIPTTPGRNFRQRLRDDDDDNPTEFVVPIADLVHRWPPEHPIGGPFLIWKCRCGGLEAPSRGEVVRALKQRNRVLIVNRPAQR